MDVHSLLKSLAGQQNAIHHALHHITDQQLFFSNVGSSGAMTASKDPISTALSTGQGKAPVINTTF